MSGADDQWAGRLVPGPLGVRPSNPSMKAAYRRVGFGTNQFLEDLTTVYDAYCQKKSA
jgi:hypothetical protein